MATRKIGKIFVGIGGWNFAPWRGSFYPKGLTQARELHYASRELTSIEINSTFYGLQKPATFKKWHDETPDGFVFSVKAPRFVTQRKRLAEGASSIERFLGSGVMELGAKLGPINWQLAPTKTFDAEELAEFLALLPRKVGGRLLRHALEARHPSFDCEQLVALAREHQVAVVEAGDSTYPRIEARTAPFSYLRVMGTKASAPKGYPPAALTRWRERAQTLARDGDVFLYFISGAKERNPQAARALIAAL
ncbi:MAG: DUF72 domain-containing protein [Pseudomonadota bacterium]